MKFPSWFTTKTIKPITPMETPPKMSDIQVHIKDTAVKAIAAYDRAIDKIHSLSGEVDAKQAAIISLTETILDLQAMLDAKFGDVGGSVGGIVEAPVQN